MKLKAVDPECRLDLTLNTAAEPVSFAAVFRRVGRKEQQSLLDVINAWGFGATTDANDRHMREQEDLILDLLIRFEGLPFEEEEGDQGVSAEATALIRRVVARRINDDTKVAEIDAGVEALLQNPVAVRRFEEIAAVMDDSLFFTKILQAAMRSVVEAGRERSKN